MNRGWRKATALALSVGAATSAANGYRPLARNGFASVFAWVAGLFVSELPLQTLVVQAGMVAWLTRRRPSAQRWFVWLLSFMSVLGLIGLHRAGRRANLPLTAALDSGLGPDRCTESAGLWGAPVTRAATAKAPGLVRMTRIYRDYAHDADISYGPHGKANLLDIWRRTDLDRGARAPVLLQVPGGAWASGNKRGQAHPLMSHLAELGWICVAINYRLSPRNTWPDQIIDVKRAIDWVKTHIADYGGDRDFIAVTGGSAGGHLSSLAALTGNDPLFQPDFTDADTRVQAAVPFYGVYDFRAGGALNSAMAPFLEKIVIKRRRAEHPDAFAAASSITYVTTDAPPFFVLHGRNDSFIPVEQARSFASELRDVSRQPVAYAELPLAQHAFDTFGSARAAHAAVAVEQFLAEVYRSAKHPGSP